MKLQVSPYNNGAGTWTEAEETAIVSYRLTHRLNAPCEAWITISDPTGVKARKYNVDANDVFVGPAKIYIEDPNGTDIFYGRLMRATANTGSRTVELYCQDWLSQLNEEQITYDMRERLSGDLGGGTYLRASTIASDYDDTDANGIAPANNVAGTFYVYDKSGILTADAHNGMKMMLLDGMAGEIQVKTGPYTYTANDSDGAMDVDMFIGVDPDNIRDLWVEDTDYYSCSDASDYTVDFNFKTWVTDSAFYVASSITGARVYITYGGFADSFDVSLELYNGATYDTIGRIIGDSALTVFKQTFDIPDNLLAGMHDANGEAIVRINVAEATGGTGRVYHLKLEVDASTTGYSTAIAITDGETYRLTVGTDLSADATKVWDGLPYCVAHEIYKHIDSAHGTLITDGDTMQIISCAATIEHTSGISTRRYEDRTRLEILQDLAQQDKAEFWMPLGTATLYYDDTWDDNPVDETLTDADVNSIISTFDYNKQANEVTAYGMRIADRQLQSTYTDAASVLKYKQTRTRTVRSSGLTAETDTLARATALVNQLKDVQQMLTVTIAGNTATAAHLKTIVVSDEITVTSTYLGLSAAYIVREFQYDSKNNETTLTLHPRVSVTGLQRDEMRSMDLALAKSRRGATDAYIPPPASDIL